MKLFYFFLAILFCIGVNAQSSLSPGKLSIGLSAEPGYYYRTLNKQEANSTGELIVNNRNEQEIAKLGYRIATTMRYQLNSMLQVESGIQYANKGYRNKKQPLVFFPSDPSFPTHASFKYRYNYLGVPIVLRALYGKQKVQFSTALGVTANMLLQVKVKQKVFFSDGHTECKTQSYTDSFKKFDLTPMLAAGAQYHLNKMMSISFETNVRYAVLQTTDTPIKERLWSAGINLGLFYNLK